MSKNPFTPHSPAYENFAGRIDELKRFRDVIKNLDSPSTLLIMGKTGVGKTSLIKQFEKVAEKEGYMSVYLGRGYKTMDEFYLNLEEGIQAKVQSTPKKAYFKLKEAVENFQISTPLGGVGIKRSSSATNVGITFQKDMEHLFKAIGREDANLILFLDQIERLVDSSKSLEPLVSLIERTAQFNIKVLVVVGLREEMFPELHSQTPAFSRYFSDTILLKRLKHQEAKDAIIQPLSGTGVEFHDAVIEDIIYNSNGDPYIIQKFCHALFSKGKDGRVTTQEYSPLCRTLLDEIHSIDWKKATKGIKEDVLKILAVEGGLNIHQIANKCSIDVCTAETIINALHNAGLIVEEKQSWELYHDRFRDYIRNKKVTVKENDLAYAKDMFDLIINFIERREFLSVIEQFEVFKKFLSIDGVEPFRRKLVSQLVAAMNDEKALVYQPDIALILGNLGDEDAISSLILAVKKENLKLQIASIQALGEIKSRDAIPILIELLENGTSETQQHVITSLGRIGDSSTVPYLIEAFKNKNARKYAISALVNIGVSSIPFLVDVLNHDDYWVRLSSVDALGKIGDSSAIKPLIIALGDKRGEVRSKAVESLVTIGKPALKHLIRALNDDDRKVRGRAAQALGKMGDVDALDALHSIKNDDDDYVRDIVSKSIAAINSKNGM